MRALILLLCVCLIESKSDTKALTESLGQEVIEIGAPVRELPAELEEEPSVESDEGFTSTAIQVATKMDARRKMATAGKDTDHLDGMKQDDEETRIEKELAEIYKDSSDYKLDSSEVKEKLNSTKDSTTVETDVKPVARMKTSFKFQPNSNNAKEVERFRTSVDEISCDRDKLSATTKIPNSAGQATFDTVLLIAATKLLL